MSKPVKFDEIIAQWIYSLFPLSIFFYLTALPAIAASFGLQLTLLTSLAMFCLAASFAQLITGLFLVQLGTRQLIFFGLLTYIISVASSTQSFHGLMLTTARSIEGISAGVILATSRYILLHGKASTKNVIAGQTKRLILTAMVTPILCSLILWFAKWTAIFWLQTAYAVLLSLIILTLLEDEAEPVGTIAWDAIFNQINMVLSSPRFWLNAIIATTSFAVLIGFVAMMSYLLWSTLSISNRWVGAIMSLVLLPCGLGAWFCQRVTTANYYLLTYASCAAIVSLLIVWGLTLWEGFHITILLLPLFVFSFAIGVILKRATEASIQPFTKQANTAACLLSGIELILTAAIILVFINLPSVNATTIMLLLAAVLIIGSLVYQLLIAFAKKSR